MSATLYLLRQQPKHISPSLFLGSDTERDIVFLEHAASGVSSTMSEIVMKPEKAVVSESSHTLTYDDLIENIFSSAHIIVI